MSTLEQRLNEAFLAVRENVVEHPDLFVRVRSSIEQDRERRRWRWGVAARGAVVVALLGAIAVIGSDIEDGRIVMPWWVLELITNIVLVLIAIVLGPFIKRFGRSYAADVFRANPRTGKSYIVLVDVAYYLIFLSYILFTMSFEPSADWASEVNAQQLRTEVARVGGILLILGLLHAANVVMLPIIGRLLSMNRQLDDGLPDRAPGRADRRGGGTPGTTGAGLPAGQWVLRIEPAPGSPQVTPPDGE
ncbi:MAG TPA: hypothetical protein VF855_13175 [Acidimicrobiales bacterium]